jgi:hypothetical protein
MISIVTPAVNWIMASAFGVATDHLAISAVDTDDIPGPAMLRARIHLRDNARKVRSKNSDCMTGT